MKRYIQSTTGKSNWNFKWVDDEYTGGNIINVYGQLTNGDYFHASDANYDAFILDSDPMVKHNGEDYDGTFYGDDYNWLVEHSTVQLSDEDMVRFWIALFNYCKKNKIELDTYDNYDEAIKALKAELE